MTDSNLSVLGSYFQSAPSWATTPQISPNPFEALSESLSVSPETASPAKPGAESPFSNAWVGGSLLLEGLGNLARGIRGMDPAPPGMATRMITDYVAQQREDKRFKELLDRLAPQTTPKETAAAIASAATPGPLRTTNPLSGLG